MGYLETLYNFSINLNYSQIKALFNIELYVYLTIEHSRGSEKFGGVSGERDGKETRG